MTAFLVLLAAALAVAGCGGGGDASGPQSFPAGVKLTYPPGWERIEDQDLALVEGRPLGGVRRKDGQGILTFRQVPATHEDAAGFATRIDRELRHRFPDISELSTRTVKTRAGTAFLASFVLSQTGSAQSIAVVPHGSKSFRIEANVPGDAPGSAREVAEIIRSFDA